MKPSLSALTLKDFAAAIAAEVNAAAGLPEPINLQCAINRGKLMVLAQHAPTAAFSDLGKDLGEGGAARQIFAHLEQQLRQQLTTLGLPDGMAPEAEQLPVQLYVKQAGQPRPYAAHGFTWQRQAGTAEGLTVPSTLILPADTEMAGDSPLTHPDSPDHREPVPIPTIESTVTYPAAATDPVLEMAVETEEEAIVDAVSLEEVSPVETALEETALAPDAPLVELPPLEVAASRETSEISAKTAEPPGRLTEALPTKHTDEDDVPEEEMIFLPNEVEDDSANRPEAVPMWDGSFKAEEMYANAEEPDVATVGEEEVLTHTPMRRQPKSRLWAAGLLSVAVVGTGGYMLSRPCVLGGCDRIPKAQDLGDAALVELADNPSPQTVLDMRQQLSDAVGLLRPIPVWSFRHGAAQASLQNYQRQLSDLDSVIAAQQDATAAAEASQSPPHPVSHWQTVAAQWETAVARLQTVSPESPIYDEIVAPKLTEYQDNQTAIQGRIDAELAADTSVNQATQSGSLATQQTQIATNLATWETALESWETAVTQLKQIPRGTLAYGEAQRLLPEYESELSQVRTRTREERIADQFYKEAGRYATVAREAGTDNQWTLAMVNWRNAITQAEGVPQGTALYAETQDLLKTYRPALGEAQENLRLAQRYQKTADDFVKACGSASELCSYTLQGGKVIVRLAEGYDDLIELSITPPDQRAAAAANTSLTARANQLFSDLTNIGKRTQLPIELQDSNGAFIARFKPELNGYVKH